MGVLGGWLKCSKSDKDDSCNSEIPKNTAFDCLKGVFYGMQTVSL